ncbi:hypothetical protein A1OO_21650 [Enterovibrio norvegicus FF-33]|uniref:DUF2850 domain-containing protein n=1 Tax=Enterovibrio norvegicus FF-454 TaxID=1185651 RepID=A0A1E5CB32_9GAMM|nr:DUF2850 domain-containing protein [Enterovibrio norvegicus]OEE62402.1 hypothetical protein A1OK_07570 [Enterovibrio norvegicus FF-454]OEE68329.1 hypothetical protein A1OO_21650 [Enterovibrio norvegicus FF-33]OEE75076.1 hypothetical protein A1OQ_07620 [Enterovibrio norvegicus FF-162]
MSIVGQSIALFVLLIGGLVGFLVANDVPIFTEVDQTVIYGEWVEQGVAPYAADKFEVRKDGIYTKGARTTSHYEFTGRKLIYTVGNHTYLYVMEDDKTLQREKPYHYSTPFIKVR